jgi:predicted O-methyltransferase YrrM
MEQLWADVDQYHDQTLVKPDAGFVNLQNALIEAELPPISVTPSLGKLFELLVRFNGSRRVLEVGTLGGYSTAWFAKGLPADGYLITLELEPKHAAIARKNLDQLSFPCEIEIKVGDAIQSLKELHESQAAPFDLIFIDADKSQYPDYLEWCIKLARKGTMIIADNVVREGAVIDERSEDLSVQGVRRFNAMVSQDPRLQATAVQTVGAKGYDGFCVIYVEK